MSHAPWTAHVTATLPTKRSLILSPALYLGPYLSDLGPRRHLHNLAMISDVVHQGG